MFRVSVQSDYFVGGVCARRGQYLKGVMSLGGGGRARPAGEEVHPDRSTWPSGLADVRGLVTGTGGSRGRASPGTRHDGHVALGSRTERRPVVKPLLMSGSNTVQTAHDRLSRAPQSRVSIATVIHHLRTTHAHCTQQYGLFLSQ